MTLEQIKIVCIDNAAETVRHDLALEFVGGIAERALAAQPAHHAQTTPAVDEQLWGRFVNHYWDSLEGHKDIVLLHVKAVLDHHASFSSTDARREAAMQELADQAQELEMGYRSPVTVGESKP